MGSIAVVKLKAIFVAFFLLALASSLVLPNVELRIDKVVPVVKAGQTAEFALLIENNESEAIPIYLFISGPSFSWIQSYEYTFDVAPGTTKRVPVKITPPLNSAPGKYEFLVKASAKISDKWREFPESSFVAEVKSETVEETRKSANVELTVDKTEYNPDERIVAVIKVTQLKQIFSELGINLQLLDSSKNPVYGSKIPITSQAEPIIHTQTVPLDSRSPPGDYYVSAELISETGKVGEARTVISINRVERKEVKRIPKYSLFSREIEVFVDNAGNVPLSGEIRERIKWYEKFLLTTASRPAFEQAGEDTELVWRYEALAPGKRTERFVYSVSYLPVVLAVVIVFLAVVAFWQSIGPLSIRKEVIKQRISQNSLEVTLSLHITNLLNRPLKDIIVLDYIPHLAKPIDFGTVAPTKVREEKTTTVIEWAVGSLKPKEELVLTYKFRTAFGVVGTLDLPAASARFTLPNSKRGVASSNSVSCGGA